MIGKGSDPSSTTGEMASGDEDPGGPQPDPGGLRLSPRRGGRDPSPRAHRLSGLRDGRVWVLPGRGCLLLDGSRLRPGGGSAGLLPLRTSLSLPTPRGAPGPPRAVVPGSGDRDLGRGPGPQRPADRRGARPDGPGSGPADPHPVGGRPSSPIFREPLRRTDQPPGHPGDDPGGPVDRPGPGRVGRAPAGAQPHAQAPGPRPGSPLPLRGAAQGAGRDGPGDRALPGGGPSGVRPTRPGISPPLAADLRRRLPPGAEPARAGRPLAHPSSLRILPGRRCRDRARGWMGAGRDAVAAHRDRPGSAREGSS